MNNLIEELSETLLDTVNAGRIDATKFLIDNGANMKKYGERALYTALQIRDRNMTMIKLLLSYADDFEIDTDAFSFMISSAIKTNDYEIIKLIFDTSLVFTSFSHDEYIRIINTVLIQLQNAHISINNRKHIYNEFQIINDTNDIVKIFNFVTSFFESNINIKEIIQCIIKESLTMSNIWFVNKNFFEHVSKYCLLADLLEEITNIKIGCYSVSTRHQIEQSYLYVFFIENNITIEFELNWNDTGTIYN